MSGDPPGRPGANAGRPGRRLVRLALVLMLVAAGAGVRVWWMNRAPDETDPATVTLPSLEDDVRSAADAFLANEGAPLVVLVENVRGGLPAQPEERTCRDLTSSVDEIATLPEIAAVASASPDEPFGSAIHSLLAELVDYTHACRIGSDTGGRLEFALIVAERRLEELR